ncbi:DUF6788 family protein [Bdellovibrionota bacterium FG-1]
MASDRQKTLQQRRALFGQMQALCHEPLMRSTISERVRCCGRPNCACARDPEARHRGEFLTVQLDGRTQAVHVRPEDRAYISKAIAAYSKLWDVINGLTACELADLKRQARERKRARQRI